MDQIHMKYKNLRHILKTQTEDTNKSHFSNHFEYSSADIGENDVVLYIHIIIQYDQCVHVFICIITTCTTHNEPLSNCADIPPPIAPYYEVFGYIPQPLNNNNHTAGTPPSNTHNNEQTILLSNMPMSICIASCGPLDDVNAANGVVYSVIDAVVDDIVDLVILLIESSNLFSFDAATDDAVDAAIADDIVAVAGPYGVEQ
eukprot:16931_1